jgi:hypothetical protein
MGFNEKSPSWQLPEGASQISFQYKNVIPDVQFKLL